MRIGCVQQTGSDHGFAQDACPCAGKATDAVLFTSAAPAVASPAEWPPTATALAGNEEVALADARAEPLGTPGPPVRGASGCGRWSAYPVL